MSEDIVLGVGLILFGLVGLVFLSALLSSWGIGKIQTEFCECEPNRRCGPCRLRELRQND